jgi:hypothetical protein
LNAGTNPNAVGKVGLEKPNATVVHEQIVYRAPAVFAAARENCARSGSRGWICDRRRSLVRAGRAVGSDSQAAINQASQSEKPKRTEIRKFVFTRFFAERELEPRLRGIDRICLARRPDVIVHGVAELAAPLAAGLAGTPAATVGFGPLLDPDVAEAAGLAAAPLRGGLVRPQSRPLLPSGLGPLSPN